MGNNAGMGVPTRAGGPPTTRPSDAARDGSVGLLPAQPTRLLGRERDLAAATALLRDSGVRLLTITGPGGVGKTRIALALAAELAHDFADGVQFVSLAALADPDLVIATVARALGLREEQARPPADQLRSHLRDRHLLLVLDNFEHLLAAAPALADLLAACRAPALLVTSRVALGLRWEHRYPLAPLALPTPSEVATPAILAENPAVALFVERARATGADFGLTETNAPAVVAVCARLDGLPLALELAAGRIPVLTPAALLARLDEPLRLLVGGGGDRPERQRTLRETIAWSYTLLSPEEQRLFRRLAVFVGGCTVEAAEAVCAADGAVGNEGPTMEILDGLASLVDKSMLRRVAGGDGTPRYAMLETVREYALERLRASSEGDALHRRLVEYYATLLAVDDPDRHDMTGMAAMLARLEDDLDTLRATLRWALDQADPDLALMLAGRLSAFWWRRGHFSEGRRWLGEALARGGSPTPRARALFAAANTAYFHGDLAAAGPLYEECIALWRSLGATRDAAFARTGLGWVAQTGGDHRRAAALFEESLAELRAIEAWYAIAATLNGLSVATASLGDPARAWALLEECLPIVRRFGDRNDLAGMLNNFGRLAAQQGDYARAVPLLEEGLAAIRAIDERQHVARALMHLGSARCTLGDHARAVEHFEEAHTLFRELEDCANAARALQNLGFATCCAGALGRGRVLLAASLEQFRRVGDRLDLADVLQNLGHTALRRGDAAGAEEWYTEALPLLRDLGAARAVAAVQALLGLLAAARGERQRATELLAESVARYRELGDAPRVAYLLRCASGVAARRERPAPAPPALPFGLTAREAEVLRLVAEGLSDAQVAERLFLSRFTVKAHLRAIYGKLGTSSRVAAARLAHDHHLT